MILAAGDQPRDQPATVAMVVVLKTVGAVSR
jgi:hypothetical protein